MLRIKHATCLLLWFNCEVAEEVFAYRQLPVHIVLFGDGGQVVVNECLLRGALLQSRHKLQLPIVCVHFRIIANNIISIDCARIKQHQMYLFIYKSMLEALIKKVLTVFLDKGFAQLGERGRT